MAARTAIVPVALAANTFTNEGAGHAVDAANGNTIADPGPFNLLLVVKNGDTAQHVLTVRASKSGVDASGAAQTNSPSDTVFAQATVGDLVVDIPAGDTFICPPLETDRFTQPDGSLSLDWDAATGMTVWAFYLPSSALGGPAVQ